MSQQQQSVFIEVPREKATKSFLAKVAQAAEKLGLRPRVKTLCKLWLTPGETVKLDETSFSLVGSDNTVQLVIDGELVANSYDFVDANGAARVFAPKFGSRVEVRNDSLRDRALVCVTLTSNIDS